MPAIDKLMSAQTISGRMVRDAMQEATGDAGKMEQLQKVCDTCADKFEDLQQYDVLVVFVQQYYKDRFEFRPNTDNPAALPPRVDEARITKVVKSERTIDTTPPPPAPRGWYRDPLDITGHAEAGAKVEFYNASQPGRPVIGETLADADGKFRFELTDETKFEYGDQIGIRVIDSSGKPSKPIVVPTEPFQLYNEKITYTRYGSVTGTEERSTMSALDRKTDNRNPFFQDHKVEPKFRPPTRPDEPYQLELVGGDDAVEPNSTISVRVGNEVYTTKADELGKFGLKVFGFLPGQLLKVEIQDVNGKGIDANYRAPDVSLNIDALGNGAIRPLSQTRPTDAREVVGNGPPWLQVSAANVTVPFGAVMLRSRATGDLYELTADDKGRVNGAIGGLQPFDVLDVGARDAAGNITGRAQLMVVLPEKISPNSGYLVPADKLTTAQPDVTGVIEAIKGPPQDLLINGKRDPRGPYLKMPDVTGMPPFGQLAVIREGKVMQYLRADQNGRLNGLLRGVHVGDQLNFQVLDAAGRKFPMELHGWRVPGDNQTSAVPAKLTHAEDRTINDCVADIGSSTLDLADGWLKPFNIKTGAVQTGETNVPLHYRREFFGQPRQDNKVDASFDFFPPTLAAKFQLPTTMRDASLELSDNQGTKRLSFQYSHTNGTTQGFSVGIDYTMGRVNMGGPNNPILVPGSLPQLTSALRGALAFLAVAYDQGKEPGDVEYDRAMGAVKTMLYVFDRVATDNPTQKDAVIAAAKAAFPDGFGFELPDRFKVPTSTVDSAAASSTTRSSGISLIDARTALLGKVSGVGQVGNADANSHPAPRIESAVVALPERSSQGGYVAPSIAPLRVRGNAQPGDIVQVYNVSSGNKTLVSEALVGPDGKFNIMANGDIQAGDQLGVMSVTADGKKSALMVVPTDSYYYSASAPANARPVKADTRPPYLSAGATELKNTSFKANGEARPGGPFWTLTGKDLCVEPFSTLTVRATSPDGKANEIKAEADAQGRFSIEFPCASRASFSVQVTDRNNNSSSLNMQTPGLATSVQPGPAAVDANAGVVSFKVADGTDIKGVVIASTLGGSDVGDNWKINSGDRSDEFVDILIKQPFGWTDENGRSVNNEYHFKIKVANDDAKKLRAQFGDKVAVNMPGFVNIQVPGRPNTEMRPTGEATIEDRDFGVL